MKTFIIITLLGSFAIVVGCLKTIDQQMVVGKYLANHQKGVDTLELKPDGSYVYQYEASDGRKVRNANKWEFKYLNGKPTIIFSAFMFGLPGYGSKDPGFWIVEVKRSLGGDLRLTIDPDLNYYYRKQ